ncbi:MAG: indole-3-glycerol phosphate synthase TrpC [Chlamydiota bacterium]
MGCFEGANDLLDGIVSAKRREISRRAKEVPVSALAEAVADRVPRDLYTALAGRPFAVIAEVKKASPSAGIIRRDYDPAAIARGYALSGAAAISVLTEETRFMGSLEHLELVKRAVSIPVLRKDFIVDEYQVYESAAAGADAVLIIARLLPAQEVANLVGLCYTLGISPLVEIHGAEEVAAAVQSGARIIGINNRDLRTLSVDIGRTIALRPLIPADRLVVSESGIRSPEDLRMLAGHGIRAALVGERLLRERDPGEALAALIGGMAEA